eukprot:scaffold1026_cov409-Prasinococcus_capsulatus_cf.AAC.13
MTTFLGTRAEMTATQLSRSREFFSTTAGECQVEHLCVKDLYTATFRTRSESSWEVEWYAGPLRQAWRVGADSTALILHLHGQLGSSWRKYTHDSIPKTLGDQSMAVCRRVNAVQQHVLRDESAGVCYRDANLGSNPALDVIVESPRIPG